MTMKTRALGALAGLFAFIAVTGVSVAADQPYQDGPVTMVSSIRTLPGMHETYLRYLATTYRTNMEAAKKEGIILDWAVYETSPRSPDEPNGYLTVTYKNMAAFDGLSGRMDAIQQKIIGSQAQRDAAMIEREKMRTMLGCQMLRKLDLK